MPFLFMDEGDAALDKTNIKNVIRFIQSQTNIQFITISLHKELYSNADMLVGVTIQVSWYNLYYFTIYIIFHNCISYY